MIARIARTRARSARITALLQCPDGGCIRSGLPQQSGSQNRSGTGICRRDERICARRGEGGALYRARSLANRGRMPGFAN